MCPSRSPRTAKSSSRTSSSASTTSTRELPFTLAATTLLTILPKTSYFRSGVYAPPSFPYILGREGAGTIVAAGANVPADLTIGTRVTYMGQLAYAEYTPVTANYVVALPDSISTKAGAAAPLQALTALTLIRDAYAVQKGDWVLVTAAAGGVGLWLCQLLKAVGARTIATASTEEKRQLAKENGAEVLLEYHEEDRDVFVKKVLEITGGEGVHAVFDSVGKATFDSSLAVVRRKGTMVSFGNASGPVTGFALAYVSTILYLCAWLIYSTVAFPRRMSSSYARHSSTTSPHVTSSSSMPASCGTSSRETI